MKRFALLGVGVVLVAACITGCSWETGSNADSWSSSYNWVSFSGVYRSAAGGLLVTDYTTTPSTPGSTNTVPTTEGQGSVHLNDTAFAGKLSKTGIVPGSVTINFGYFAASDDGNGILTAPMGSGSISYASGTWTFNGAPQSIIEGPITAGYSYYISNDGSPGSGALPGSTGRIYSFSLVHQGQNLTITDNNGATYIGLISEIRSASGAQNTDIGQVGADESGNDKSKYTYYESPLPEDGDKIIASFEVSGISAASMQVKIVGTLSGSVAAGVFTGRTMNGTWIELGGKTGDIRGQTTPMPIVSAPAEEAPAEPDPAAAVT